MKIPKPTLCLPLTQSNSRFPKTKLYLSDWILSTRIQNEIYFINKEYQTLTDKLGPSYAKLVFKDSNE